ncbi:MAG: nonstructural protein [Microviridae sp.]|nr:MAG: nonstructural protein [Microviridae sp.]
MITFAVSVKDRAIDAFNTPIFVKAVGEATRSFVDECNNKESNLNKHPEDFDLYQVGTFDDSTGSFQPCAPKLIARAQDCVKG